MEDRVYISDHKKSIAISFDGYRFLSVHRIHWASEVIIFYNDNSFSVAKSRYIDARGDNRFEINLPNLTEMIHDDKLIAWLMKIYNSQMMISCYKE